MVSNKSLIFKKIPAGMPVPGEHMILEDRPLDLDAVPAGGLVVEVLSVSMDPYLRGKMRDASIRSYTPAFVLDEPMHNDAVGRVLKSDAPAFRAGDHIYANLPFAEYAALSAERTAKAEKLENPYKLAWDYFLGPLGMPGLTAYSGLYKIGKPKKGETIYVNSSAGQVGQVVAQLAKREGLTVIGSVGSDDKLDFILNEVGFDGAFNYKKEKIDEALTRLAPKGIDVYWENVGGEQFEVTLNHLNDFARIVACGMISGYNKPPSEQYGVRNLICFITKRLSMQGFIVSDPGYGDAYHEEHQANVQKWLADGSFKAKLDITWGLDNAAPAFVSMFRGENFGKPVLKIRD